MGDLRAVEQQRRKAWEERRRTRSSPAEQAIDALWVQLFGDPRNPTDRGAVGDNTARIERLERLAYWIAGAVVMTMLLLIGDLTLRILK